MAMTQKRKLATYVRVAGRRWGPEDDIPDEVAEKITNPKAWAAPTDDDGDEQSESGPRKPRGGTRSGQRLASYVHVGGRRYGPDDPIPDQVAARITNPKAWEGGKIPRAKGGLVRGPGTGTSDEVPLLLPGADYVLTRAQVEEMERRADADAPPAEAPAGESTEASAEAPAAAAPPRSGKGSGVDKWVAFAQTHNVDVPDGATREDIIAACERVKVIEAVQD